MQEPSKVIPYEKFVLDNGLEVCLHEDHSDPVCSVYVYYHVGSSREDEGLSGFAHLFEHMLFQGSAHVPDNDHFRLIQQAGGTLNGTTNQDRTNYYETLPANQLELALWLEADRMGFLLPAMTQEKLDNQRDVVMNERRQSYESRPYGLVYENVLGALYPSRHPYSWPTIGSMKDIGAATLEDIDRFFRRWYGPNNATLAIGGDFDPAEARRLVERYFGGIPRCPAVDKPGPQPTALEATRRLVIEDRVQQPQLSMVWPTVEAWHPDEPALDLLTDVVSANKSSLFDRVLMIEEELASRVVIAHAAQERAGKLMLEMRPHSGVSLDTLEQRVHELVERLVREGVDPGRLQSLKNRREGWMYRSLETVSARTNQLAFDNCFSNDPGRIDEDFARHRAVTAEEVVEVAKKYLLGRPYVALSCVPEGKGELAATGHTSEPVVDEVSLDRSVQPAPGVERPFQAPAVWRTKLEGGPTVVGTPYAKLPLTRLSLGFPAGRLLETQERLGLSSLTAEMLEEGTKRLSSTELQDELDGLGAEFHVRPDDDDCLFELAVLNEHLPRAVELVAEIVGEPRFDGADFERLKRQRLVDIQTRKDRLGELATEAFAALVYGRETIKGSPRYGTRESISALTLEDVAGFWRDHVRLAAGHLCVVGEKGSEESRRLFARLGGEASSPEREAVPELELQAFQKGLSIHVVDKPGTPQSELRIGHRGIARTDPDFFPLYVLNYMLGGSFTSRLNLNLREDKGYTYGVHSNFTGGRTQGVFFVGCAVETAVTGPAVGEVLHELGRVHEGIGETEVDFARRSISQAIGRSLESAHARLGMLESITRFGFPDDYTAERMRWLEGVGADAVNALAARYLDPENLVCVVAGDREKIAPQLEALGRGPVQDVSCELEPVN